MLCLSTFVGPFVSTFVGPFVSTFVGPFVSTFVGPFVSTFMGPFVSTFMGPFVSTFVARKHGGPEYAVFAVISRSRIPISVTQTVGWWCSE